MKFFSPTEEPIHVALTSGHSALVTHEGVELAPMFHREAAARGARRKGASQDDDLDTITQNRSLSIKETLQGMRDGNVAGDFTKDGKPDLRKLIAKVGFRVSRDEADAVWEELTKVA